MKTRVLFRTVLRGDFAGQVDAVFPDDAGSNDANTCSCYCHIGQHGFGSVSYWQTRTRNATASEFARLKRELEAAPYGYRFQVITRFPANSRRKRLEQLA
jgi:hypothetical protein